MGSRRLFFLIPLLACFSSSSSASDQHVVRVLTKPTRASTIPIDVGPTDGRIVFSSLRSTSSIQSITLRRPDGRIAWSRSGPELQILPREQTASPSHGDSVRIPSQEDAEAGRWELSIESVRDGTVILAFQALPRISMNFAMPFQSILAQRPVLLQLYATNDGLPLNGLTNVEIVASSGKHLVRAVASQTLRTTTGATLTSDTGAYSVLVTFPAAGRYQLEAHAGFGESVLKAVPSFVEVLPSGE